jgi:uncharacterized membrane protein YfcA
MIIIFCDKQFLGFLRFVYPCITDYISCCIMTKVEGQVISTPNVQPPAPAQTLQPVAAAPTGVISTMRTLTQHQFNWHHAVAAVGVLAVSGAGTAVLVKVSKNTLHNHTVMLVNLLMLNVCFLFPKMV